MKLKSYSEILKNINYLGTKLDYCMNKLTKQDDLINKIKEHCENANVNSLFGGHKDKLLDFIKEYEENEKVDID